MNVCSRSTRRARRTLASLLLSAIGLAVASPVALASHPGHRAGQDVPPLPGATPILVVVPHIGNGNGSNTGTLSAAQRQSTMRIALRDAYVRNLIRHKPYHQAGSATWTYHGQMVGGVARIAFSRPVTLSGRWLTSGRPFSATYRNVKRISAYVDLARSRVVTITPR